MSTVKVNAITDASGGNTATINSMTPTADSLQGFRNRIINGDMRIDQRNAGASVTPGDGAYTLDRWQVRQTVSSKFSAQRSTTTPTGFTNSALLTSLSSYSIGSGDIFGISQSIEGFNVADLGWGAASAQTITLSFWVRSSLTGTFGGAIKNGSGNRAYPFTYAVSSANTWEQKVITVPGDTTGTWATDNSAGIKPFFSIGSGTSQAGTAGAWAAGDFYTATGATSVVGTNGATFYITGVQLEVGSVATPFERRPYGTELMLCQRYYYKIASGNTKSIYTAAAYSSTQIYGSFPIPVTMRTAPTLSSTTGTNYYTAFSNSASDAFDKFTLASETSESVAELIGDTNLSVTAGYCYFVRTNNASAFIALQAEL